jgi:hypothetical protein
MPIRSLCVCVYAHTRYFLREVGEEYAKALLLVIFGTGIGCAEAAAARASRRLLRPEPLVILVGQMLGLRGGCCGQSILTIRRHNSIKLPSTRHK